MNEVVLPEGWIKVSISDINTYSSKNITPSDFAHEVFELYSVPIFSERRPEYLLGEQIGSSKQQVQPHDVLLCKINPRINRVWFVADVKKNRQIASSEWIVIRQSSIDTRYLVRYFQSAYFRDLLCSDVSGVGGSLTRAQPKKVDTYLLPLPPLAEQKVIADKLDSLLAQVDNIKTRLDALPTIIKRFKQSVLSAAVSGKLTEDWRGGNSCFLEEGLDLLVQSERKKKGIKASRKVVSIEFDSVPFNIPESWAWKALGDIALKITDGAHNTPQVIHEGFPYLMAKDLTGGMLDFSENRFISEAEHTELYSKCKPEKGDLLIVNIGAGTGNNVLIDVDFEFSFKNIAIIKRPSFIEPKFLKYFYEAEKQRIFNEQTRGGAQPFLSLTVLNGLLFALPPKTEQTEIVRRVEQLFAYADQIEQQVKNAQSRVNNLTQAILAKAFRGELTADWRAANPHLISGENSAQALLAKIKAERDKPKKTSKQQTMFNE